MGNIKDSAFLLNHQVIIRNMFSCLLMASDFCFIFHNCILIWNKNQLDKIVFSAWSKYYFPPTSRNVTVRNLRSGTPSGGLRASPGQTMSLMSTLAPFSEFHTPISSHLLVVGCSSLGGRRFMIFNSTNFRDPSEWRKKESAVNESKHQKKKKKKKRTR